MTESSDRRLQVLQSHLQAPGQQAGPILEMQQTAASVTDSTQEYSVVLPERLSDTGPWTVRRSATCPKELATTYPSPDDHIRTLYDVLEHTVQRHPEINYLGTRTTDSKGKPGPYTWMTYAQVAETRTHIGSGLLHLGIKPGSTVGLYSVNHTGWLLVDAACAAYSMTSVPLIDVLDTLLKCLPECPTVKIVLVYAMKPGQQLPPTTDRVSAKLYKLEDVAHLGQQHPKAHIPPSPTDLCTICYTSGTTGVPKGAMLTHGNLVADSAGMIRATYVAPGIVQTAYGTEESVPGDRYISYLPLAHIYERVITVSVTYRALSIGFYRGNVLELLDDIQELKPHMFCSVPRLWNRIYDRVNATIQASNPISRKLFETAYKSKKAALDRGDLSGGKMAGFWDKLVFSKIKARIGGETKFMSTGASPISTEVFEFLRICFGATVSEGYGMTETACTIAMTRPDDATMGHVGAPLDCCEIKLEDIPDMNYKNTDQPYPRGEICVRGPTIFKGYLKDEEKTREVLDVEGWLHTGDVGTWLPGGRLKIIDRKKNIFKLAQGEYVAPEKIENVYVRCPLVAQSFVYGDSLRPQLVAVVIPDPEALQPWAASRRLTQDVNALCNDDQVKSAIMKSMQEEGRAAGLKGFEQVAAIHLHPEPFSIENGMMTPTFKVKRPQAKQAFQKQLDAMYAKLEK
ncbi:hypothetical protein WJX82_007734 [Trebouxia sp. C0006]